MADIHVGDVGTELVLVVTDEDGEPVDVSAASDLTIKLKKPGVSGEVLTRTAVPDTTGADGKIRYDTEDGDLDTPGRWVIQGEVAVGAAFWHTKKNTFSVLPNVA